MIKGPFHHSLMSLWFQTKKTGQKDRFHKNVHSCKIYILHWFRLTLQYVLNKIIETLNDTVRKNT